MKTERAFFDTNVLVHAYDANDKRKRDIARRLLLDHVGAGTFCTSAQALSEYFSVVTTRGEVRLGTSAAAWLMEQLPTTAIVVPGLDTVKTAARRCSDGGLTIWDALIVEAAREAGASLLYTEHSGLIDLVDESRDGLRAIDPFSAGREVDWDQLWAVRSGASQTGSRSEGPEVLIG